MPHRYVPDPSFIDPDEEMDAVKRAVSAMARQIHAAAEEVDRVISREVIRATQRDLELERNQR